MNDMHVGRRKSRNTWWCLCTTSGSKGVVNGSGRVRFYHALSAAYPLLLNSIDPWMYVSFMWNVQMSVSLQADVD